MKRRTHLGDYPVMGYVRLGTLQAPVSGLVDTGTKYSILPRDLAERAGSRPLGRTGKINILKRTLHGEIHRVHVTDLEGGCRGDTTVFVPDASADWKRGVLFGAEFLQDTGMHVNDKGEAYCPIKKKSRRKL